MQIINSPDMPFSNGHYSMCIERNKTLYISGQLPIDPKSNTIPDSIEAQTHIVLHKLKTIVNTAGSTIDKVIQVRIYLSNITLWDKVNTIYSEFVGDHKPVRAIVPTRKLHHNCLIELEATAAK